MTMLEQVSAYLSWSLGHFVWQGAVLLILFQVAMRIGRHAECRVRYAVAAVTMGLLLVSPAMSLVVSTQVLDVGNSDRIIQSSAVIASWLQQDFEPTLWQRLAELMANAPRVLLWLWVGGVAFGGIQIARDLTHARRLASRSRPTSDQMLRTLVAELASEFNLPTAPRVAMQCGVTSPMVSVHGSTNHKM